MENEAKLGLVKSDKPLNDQKKTRKPRIGRLNSARDVRREMARVYRKARHGEITTNDLNNYIKALSAMVGPIREGEFEERLSKLEGR